MKIHKVWKHLMIPNQILNLLQKQMPISKNWRLPNSKNYAKNRVYQLEEKSQT